jgi:hypothetical protein
VTGWKEKKVEPEKEAKDLNNSRTGSAQGSPGNEEEAEVALLLRLVLGVPARSLT